MKSGSKPHKPGASKPATKPALRLSQIVYRAANQAAAEEGKTLRSWVLDALPDTTDNRKKSRI